MHARSEHFGKMYWQSFLPVDVKCAANAELLPVEFSIASPREKGDSGEIQRHCHATTTSALSLEPYR